MDREALYLKLPVWMQNVVVSAEGARLNKRRYDAGFRRLFSALADRPELHGDALRQFQADRLRVFLAQAACAAFWRTRFEEFDVDIAAADPLREFRKLPVLTKAEAKANIAGICVYHRYRDLLSCHTSGTTGSALVFKTTREAEREQWGVWWRYRHWHGITFDKWCGYFGGRSLVPLTHKAPPYWRLNRPAKQLMFSAYHLKEDTAVHYIEALRRHRIKWLHGYPSTLSILASFVLDQKLAPLDDLEVVTTGAESLMPQQRKVIREAFGAPVFQHYGQAEGVANISECQCGNMHVDEDFALVEFVPLEQAPDTYRVVGTNWTNPAFPLLRYDTGDLVRLSQALCHCGRRGRIVSEIDGRREDVVVLPDGSLVGRLDHIFKDLVHIRAAQIFQPRPGEVVLRVVKENGYDAAFEERRLLTDARKRLGADMVLSIDYVTDLSRTSTGKLRFVVSDCAANIPGRT